MPNPQPGKGHPFLSYPAASTKNCTFQLSTCQGSQACHSPWITNALPGPTLIINQCSRSNPHACSLPALSELSLSVTNPYFSDGAGRTGTYILIDMVLNRMAKGKVCSHSTRSPWSLMAPQYPVGLRPH